MEYDALGEIAIFRNLEPLERQALASRARPRVLAPGTAVIHEGDAGSSLYIVRAGELRAYLNENGTEVELGVLRPGDYFGEMSLLTGAPRSATVLAIAASEVLEITKADLAPLMARHPSLAARMGETLTTRQESNLKTLMDRPAEFVSASVGDDGCGLDTFELAHALANGIKAFFGLPASVWSRAADSLGGIFAGRGASGSAPETERETAFTTAMIALTAKMASTAGSYGGAELAALKDAFTIDTADMPAVRRVYDKAQGNPKDYAGSAKRIADVFTDDPVMLEELMGILLGIASAGGARREAMFSFAGEVAAIFAIAPEAFERLRATAAHGGDATGGDDIDYLAILGVTADSPAAEVKTVYRRLAVENHPDKLIARGMPAELIEAANRKLATVNLAYDQFRAARGIA